jgi:hypothetical protein
MNESEEKSFLENKMSRYARHDKKRRTGLPNHPAFAGQELGNDNQFVIPVVDDLSVTKAGIQRQIRTGYRPAPV